MSILNFMQGDTFTFMARCEKTGMLGIVQATSEIALGSRCPVVKARVGAVVSQACTEPRLRLLGMTLLERGYSAPKVVQELKESDPYIEYRQIGVIDKDGNAAAYTGGENHEWAGHINQKNYISMGNFLTSERTITAMVESFESSDGEPLEERLMRAIEAGEAAGGQRTKSHSAVILVHDWDVFSRVDLRVDYNADPFAELRRIFEAYKPLIPYYVLRPRQGVSFGPIEFLIKQGANKEDLERYYPDELEGVRHLLKGQEIDK